MEDSIYNEMEPVSRFFKTGTLDSTMGLTHRVEKIGFTILDSQGFHKVKYLHSVWVGDRCA